MSKDRIDIITVEIERAHALAAERDIEVAVHSFALAREMALKFTDPVALNRTIKIQIDSLAREREKFRALIAKHHGSGGPVLVLADSLGLPRPQNITGPTLGAQTTYPWLIAQALPERSLTSICQRFFTTEDVRNLLEADPTLGAGSDVVIHLGLNDCANRMFQENERLALSLLPEAVSKQIVSFAQKYRRDILRLLPPRHYVTPDAFRSNLAQIAALLRSRGAKQVAIATIILPPSKFWQATPGINRNFTSYNLAIMDAAHEFNLSLLEIDRNIWQTQHESVLLEDGMHLSDAGHRIFSREARAALKL